MADPSQIWKLSTWDFIKAAVPPSSALISLILIAFVFWLKSRIEKADEIDESDEPTPAPVYRIYPDHNRWTRTEVIATAGLLVALLGLIVSLLRH